MEEDTTTIKNLNDKIDLLNNKIESLHEKINFLNNKSNINKYGTIIKWISIPIILYIFFIKDDKGYICDCCSYDF
jgi:hypothetical protein